MAPIEEIRAEVDGLPKAPSVEALERIVFDAMFPRTAWETRSTEKRRRLALAVQGVLRAMGRK